MSTYYQKALSFAEELKSAHMAKRNDCTQVFEEQFKIREEQKVWPQGQTGLRTNVNRPVEWMIGDLSANMLQFFFSPDGDS